VLVFLPGFREIRLAREALVHARPALAPDIAVLHGRLPPAAQRQVLDPPAAAARRIILATNVAETSLTIPGVRAVVDSGLERRVRFHPRTGMDHWETVEISVASARQRQGRAGRLGPGICLRWWHSDAPRRPFSPPEILEADLAPLLLETALWGAVSPLDLTWITPPPAGALQQAGTLLKALGLIDGAGRITASGRQAAGLGLHPRLACMVLNALARGWLPTAAVTAALLEEGDPLGGDDPDFRDRLAAWAARARGVKSALRPDVAQRIGREAERILRAAGPGAGVLRAAEIDPDLAGRLLLFAYPDRAAQRVGGGHLGEAARFVLATGRGARVTGPLAREAFLVAADLDGGETEARVFLAAPVTRGEIEGGLAGQPETVHLFAWEGWVPRSRTEVRVGRIVLVEARGAAAPPEALRQAARERIGRDGLDGRPGRRRPGACSPAAASWRPAAAGRGGPAFRTPPCSRRSRGGSCRSAAGTAARSFRRRRCCTPWTAAWAAKTGAPSRRSPPNSWRSRRGPAGGSTMNPAPSRSLPPASRSSSGAARRRASAASRSCSTCSPRPGAPCRSPGTSTGSGSAPIPR
ncbi:MAG: hypothetical protein M0P04_05620, partial [Syntrophales bacterium]|nr:hypothetical protein [Syntrophales bacterium]